MSAAACIWVRLAGAFRLLPQAVAKRLGSPMGLPNNVLRTVCGFHEIFLEHCVGWDNIVETDR
eukprot:8525879-Pyramimonas_sp.AAC.1